MFRSTMYHQQSYNFWNWAFVNGRLVYVRIKSCKKRDKLSLCFLQCFFVARVRYVTLVHDSGACYVWIYHDISKNRVYRIHVMSSYYALHFCKIIWKFRNHMTYSALLYYNVKGLLSYVIIVHIESSDI